MSPLDDVEPLTARLTTSERAQLLQSLVRELGDSLVGIESRADVCGGEPCILRTRIPVWVLERARQSGLGDVEILRAYPTLRAGDLVNAWAYVQAYRNEIERQISENEAA